MFRACLIWGYIGDWHEGGISTGGFDATDNSFGAEKV
jgi:hypothetical protein